MRSIVAMRLPALPPKTEPDVVRETRPIPTGVTNPAVDRENNVVPNAETNTNTANQDTGEPIHMTLEEIQKNVMKGDHKTVGNYINVNVPDKRDKAMVNVSDKDADEPPSGYYNVNGYDNLRRPGKNKSKDVNVDQEYAEVNVEGNMENRHNGGAKASKAIANVGVQYAAIDKDRIKRKKGGDSS